MKRHKRIICTARVLAPPVLVFGFVLAGFAQSPTPDDFNPGAQPSPGIVYSIALQPDGKIVAGGYFDMVCGQPRNGLARINPDGSLDLSFDPGGRAVLSIVVQADGKILVGGTFNTLAGQSRTAIGRLNPDGTLDVNFNPVPAGGGQYGTYVELLAVQADGKILVSGSFTILDGQPSNGLGRLNSDGTLDMSFNPAVTNYTHLLGLQPDGRILVGGWFTPEGATNGYGFYVGRLNGDGTLDQSFSPAATDNGCIAALQADGKILVGGPFTMLRGQRHFYLGRLNADGTVDTGFNLAGAPVSKLAFYHPDNVYQPLVWSLAVQADGKILVGGIFGYLYGLRHNLGRLNADGTADASFDPQIADIYPTLYTLVPQGDGKVLIGGTFTTVGGLSRTNIARINNTGPATQSLTFGGSTVTWLRGGTGPEVWRVTFEYSLNGPWTNLGAGTRIPGGWQLSGLDLPRNASIRARGYTMHDIVETQWHPPLLISDVQQSPGSHLAFKASGPYGQAVVIEASPDLRTWSPMQTNTVGGDPIPFSDSQPAVLPSRYYRLRSQL